MSFFEIAHPLLTHGDVSEHDLKSLGEVEATFFLKLLDNFLLGVFKNSPGIKESLGEEVLVEAFKDVLIL